MAGDEQVPPGPVPEGLHRLPDVARDVAAAVDHRVPAAAGPGRVGERRVVAGVPVAGEPGDPGEQVRPGPAPAEQGHLGPGAQGVFGDGAADEGRAAENEDPHPGTLPGPPGFTRAARNWPALWVPDRSYAETVRQ